MYKHSELGAGTDGNGAPIPRVGRLSRSTVRSAIDLLRRQHSLADSETTFDVLRTVSQQHNVKLRVVAAAIVGPDIATQRAGNPPGPPPLTFSDCGDTATPNRTEVLRDLMRTAITDVGADYGNIQVRDPAYGGLTIESHKGFKGDFLDFFGYVDDAGSACGASLTEACQVVVDDVESAPVFAESERTIVLTAGVRSVVSTPLVDEHGSVRGVVSTHYAQSGRAPNEKTLRTLQVQADDCARWLSWYDRAVMPRVLAAVHAAAGETRGEVARQR